MFSQVRYFGQLVDPRDHAGKGVRGLLIRFMNAIRVWLEKKIVFALLRVELDGKGASKEEKKAFLLSAEQGAWGQQQPPKVAKSRPVVLAEEGAPSPLRTREEVAESRYSGPRRKRSFEENIAGTLASYEAQRGNRAARYISRRMFRANPEEEIEEVQHEQHTAPAAADDYAPTPRDLARLASPRRRAQ
jgi:hypothetical protein